MATATVIKTNPDGSKTTSTAERFSNTPTYTTTDISGKPVATTEENINNMKQPVSGTARTSLANTPEVKSKMSSDEKYKAFISSGGILYRDEMIGKTNSSSLTYSGEKAPTGTQIYGETSTETLSEVTGVSLTEAQAKEVKDVLQKQDEYMKMLSKGSSSILMPAKNETDIKGVFMRSILGLESTTLGDDMLGSMYAVGGV